MRILLHYYPVTGPDTRSQVPSPDTWYQVPGPDTRYQVPGPDTRYQVPDQNIQHPVPGNSTRANTRITRITGPMRLSGTYNPH